MPPLRVVAEFWDRTDTVRVVTVVRSTGRAYLMVHPRRYGLPPLGHFEGDLLDPAERALLLANLPPSVRPDVRRILRRRLPDLRWAVAQLRAAS
jgi:hypothetical protein